MNWRCWLFGHDWLCLARWQNYLYDNGERGQLMSEMTGWSCSRCNTPKTEQWDWP